MRDAQWAPFLEIRNRPGGSRASFPRKLVGMRRAPDMHWTSRENGPIPAAFETGSEGMEDIEREIKELIVEALMLDDVSPEDIDSSAPLFVEGLGLDSIDALELAMAIDKRFGVRIRADDEANKSIFANVKNLAAYVAQNRA